MARPKVYPDEFRERVARLLLSWREARGVEGGGLRAVCKQLDLNPETLRRWYFEAEGGDGRRVRPATPKSDRERVAELERENRELRRANEILKSAAAFFGAELDRRPKK
jgi:transposase